MISLEKLKILTPLRKLHKNDGDLGKLIVTPGFEKLPKSNKSSNLVTLLANKSTDPIQSKCHLGYFCKPP